MTDSPYIGIRFMEWVLARIRELSGSLLHEGELYDERELSLGALLDRKLGELDGITCLVTLPKMVRQGSEPENSNGHTISLMVYIRCNPELTGRRSGGKLDSFELAVRLYEGLDGTHFEVRPRMLPNVTTSRFSNSTGGKNADGSSRGAEHAFEISANITLNTPN